MDLQLYARVLLRHRFVLVLGLVLAAALAFLAYVRVDFEGTNPVFSYRDDELWQDRATLLLTQRGFPEGRSVFPPAPETTPGDQGSQGSQGSTEPPYYAGQGRFTELTDVYAQIATGDAVRARMLRDGPIEGTFAAGTLRSTAGGGTPILQLFATGTTPAEATALTRRVTGAFLSYLDSEQARADIPANQRVDIQVLTRSGQLLLLQPRKKTLPIVVLLAVLVITIALVFTLENTRKQASVSVMRPETPPATQSDAQPPDTARRIS